ncbi:ALF repeat-containing protein [Streptomyces sp. NPDC007002]|uniref:ALF repeat-containing protein n=1 Tax=Streptomyces sp. NPDC007002 TaxID=3156910 RepID=UPI003456066D
MTLSATLLGTTPSHAADPEPPANRSLAVGYWLSGGTGIREAAEQALVGTDDDIRQFLTDAPAIQEIDDRVDLSRVVNAGGPAVREAATQALTGTPADVEAFLDNGWKEAVEQDRRVEATRVVNFGGPGVQDAGTEALQGTAADVKQFLDVG